MNKRQITLVEFERYGELHAVGLAPDVARMYIGGADGEPFRVCIEYADGRMEEIYRPLRIEYTPIEEANHD